MDGSIIIRLHKELGYAFIFLNLHLVASQDCTFPVETHGTWTSTNLGTMVITGTSPSLTFTKLFTAQDVSVNEMECRFTSGTQYILQSKYEIYTFSSTNPIYMWMCLDLHKASAYAYYYYLNSAEESGFDGYRLVGLLSSTTVTISDVCTTTLDTAEFNIIIEVGSETNAVDTVDCADSILGFYRYTYTDSTATTDCTSSVTSSISTCDSSKRTHILVNNTGCTAVDPFNSTGGSLGCIANVHDTTSDVYYISLYNIDTSLDKQFVCIAVTKASTGTVYLSMKQNVCVSGQSPTTLPTGGATMVLTPDCIIDNSSSKRESWVLWIILLPCIALLIVFVIIVVCLYMWTQKRERIRARRKNALEHTDHPLGEMSLELDAPASMDREDGYYDDKRYPFGKAKPRKNGIKHKDILGEQSLNLDLNAETWTQFERGQLVPVTDDEYFSGAATSGSDPKSGPQSSKPPKSLANRWKTASKNLLKARMVANTFNTITAAKSQNPKSYERSTKASSGKGPVTKVSNGLHSVPLRKPTHNITGSRAGSRAGSIKGSRKGSIDNLVITRNNRLLRSKTTVVSEPKEGKRLDIYTMPEEYVTDGGPNEIIPARPKHVPAHSDILRDTYQSYNRRSLTQTMLKQPSASKYPWY